MRRLFLLFLTFAWACPALAAGPAEGPGCLGVTADECVRWLRTTMTLDEGFLASALAQRRRVDVNGRPIGGAGMITVNGNLPGRIEPFAFLLHLGPGDIVRSVESNLLQNVMPAHTEELYDQSALYEVVTRLLGRRCGAIVKLDLYRFFENIVKPRIRQQREDVASGLFGLHRVLSHAEAVPYCGGVTFSYTNLVEWRGSADVRAGRNQKDFSSIKLQ